MKAVSYDRFGGPEVLEYLDLPDPTPGPRQLLIETAAIGVNFPDIRERLGVYNKAETRVGGVRLPQVGGLAVAGSVVAAGPETSVPVGRRVVALMKKGAYAQRAVAEEALCAVVDDDASDEQVVALAGFAAQGACAHLLLQASTTLRPGESVLVHGAAGAWAAWRCKSRKCWVPARLSGRPAQPSGASSSRPWAPTRRSPMTSPGGPSRYAR